jgi:hypothetical protein
MQAQVPYPIAYKLDSQPEAEQQPKKSDMEPTTRIASDFIGASDFTGASDFMGAPGVLLVAAVGAIVVDECGEPMAENPGLSLRDVLAPKDN